MVTSSLPERRNRPPLIVLGVEQEWAARSLETVLAPSGFALVRGHSGRETIDLATSISPDAILVDSRLPDIDGLDVCRALRQEQRVGAHVPVVLMTSGTAPRELLREAYRAGVWSVWEQPLDGELLGLRLRTWANAKRMADEAERTRVMDDDQKVYTHFGLQHRAEEMVSDAARRCTPIACIALGALVHSNELSSPERPMPARLASDLGRAVAAMARGSDVVGRVGRGAYAILAPDTEQEGAMAMVARVHQRLAALPPLIQGGQAYGLVVRAGIALRTHADAAPADASGLLARAGTALRFAHASRTAPVISFDEVPSTFV